VKDDTAYLFLEDRPGLKGSTNLEVDVPTPAATPIAPNPLDDEGFQIIDPTLPRPVPLPPRPPAPSRADSVAAGKSPYKTLAVRPATNVLPLLHNTLSSFVLGISKSARAVRPSLPTQICLYADMDF